MYIVAGIHFPVSRPNFSQPRPRVFAGERKRKILCSRESDRVVVSDQRCHGTTRPAVITEPCNAECELRFVAPQGHRRERIISQPLLSTRPHLTRAWPCCVQVARGPQERVHGPVRPGIPDPGNILRQDQPRRRKDPEGGRPLLQRAAQTRQQGSLPRRLQPGRLGLLTLVGGRCGGFLFFLLLACGGFPHIQPCFFASTVHQELRWGNPPSRGSVP